MKPAKLMPCKSFLCMLLLPAFFLPSVALGEEPKRSPEWMTVSGEPDKVREIVITVERKRLMGFFEQYILSRTRVVPTAWLPAESSAQRPFAKRAVDLRVELAALPELPPKYDVDPWRANHIGVTMAF